MPYYSLKKTIAAASILTALFISPALAQDSAQNVEEIIVEGRYLYADKVNALKTPTPILDVPQSLSIMTDFDIKQRGFRELSDIMRYARRHHNPGRRPS